MPCKDARGDQSSLILKSIIQQDTENKTVISPGLSPTSKGFNQTYERILDNSAIGNSQKYQVNQREYHQPQLNQENVSQNRQQAPQNTQRYPSSRQTPVSPQEILKPIQNIQKISQVDERRSHTSTNYQTGSFGGQKNSENSPMYSYHSQANNHIQIEQHSSTSNMINQESSNRLSMVKTPYPSTNQLPLQYLKTSPQLSPTRQSLPTSYQNHPHAQKELIVNLQEEVNFLAKQNSRLKSALMNANGLSLMSSFQKSNVRQMEYITNKMSAISLNYQNKVDLYNAKVQSMTKAVSYLKNKMQEGKKKQKEFKEQALGQIAKLQSQNQNIVQEKTLLDKEGQKMGELMSQKELKIQQLQEELGKYKANQITESMKEEFNQNKVKLQETLKLLEQAQSKNDSLEKNLIEAKSEHKALDDKYSNF